MPSRELPYPVFDADNHFYEPKEALTKFLPDHRKGVIDYIDVRGRTKIMVRGHISDYIPNPTFEVVARPGAQEEYFRHGSGGKSYREVMGKPMKAIPAFRNPEARLEVMDALGLDYTLMFPTLASLVEERMKDDPDLIHDIIHALNQWMYETWQFNYEDRIFSTPVITLPIVDRALEELEWCLERGAKTVLVRPAPVPGYRGSRSIGPGGIRPVLAGLREGRHPGVDARLGQRLRPVPQRLGARRRVPAVQADLVPDGRDGQAAHRGHHGGTGLPRRADPQPRSAHPVRRKRRIVGALPVLPVQGRLLEDAAGVPGGPDRGVQALRLRRAVLGGRFRQDGRPVRHRPRHLRLRLAASGGPVRSDQPGRRPSGASIEEGQRKIMGGNMVDLFKVPNEVVYKPGVPAMEFA